MSISSRKERRRPAGVATVCICAITTALAVSGLFLAPPAARAEFPPDGGFFLGTGINYGRGEITRSYADGDRKAKDHGLGDGVFQAGLHVTEHLTWEAGLQIWNEEDGRFERQDVRLITTSLALHHWSGFYARIGAGQGRIEVTVAEPRLDDVIPRTHREHGIAYLGGIGFRHFFNERVGIAFELEGSYIHCSSELHAFYGAANLTAQLYLW
jgi:hypothetical protein